MVKGNKTSPCVTIVEEVIQSSNMEDNHWLMYCIVVSTMVLTVIVLGMIIWCIKRRCQIRRACNLIYQGEEQQNEVILAANNPNHQFLPIHPPEPNVQDRVTRSMVASASSNATQIREPERQKLVEMCPSYVIPQIGNGVIRKDK